MRVDFGARQYVLECWPWDADPKSAGTRQFDGWPHTLKFEEA